MLSARLVTALALLAGCIAALLFLPNRWWAAVLLPVLAVAAWEWGALAGIRSSNGNSGAGTSFGPGLCRKSLA